jgi:hypothetical protein
VADGPKFFGNLCLGCRLARIGLTDLFAHTLLLLLFCWLGLACELVEGLVSFSALTFLKYF